MYQEFSISTINVDAKTKTVVISCNMDVDPTSITSANVELFELTSRNVVEYDTKVVGGDITLTLVDWPKPNLEYVLRVQELKSVLGEALVSGVRRKVIFESSICSRLEITYPAYDEVITDLRVAFTEIPKSVTDPTIGSYYIEISTENAFHNLVKKTTVIGQNEVDLSDLPKGQYYVRGRVQKDSDYGLWSDVVTFIISSNPIVDPVTPPEEIYTPEIEIISTPKNGETPSNILIEFDSEIDPNSISNIVVVRRTI